MLDAAAFEFIIASPVLFQEHGQHISDAHDFVHHAHGKSAGAHRRVAHGDVRQQVVDAFGIFPDAVGQQGRVFRGFLGAVPDIFLFEERGGLMFGDHFPDFNQVFDVLPGNHRYIRINRQQLLFRWFITK